MNLGENIRNAFSVVGQTYENINKLMDFCKATAAENNEFELSSPKFLRWKSDKVSGWYIFSFILLFQCLDDLQLDNDWRDGPIYVLEINLDPDTYDVPTVNVAKYEYADMSSWSEGCSPANHWVFYDPLYDAPEIKQDGDLIEKNIVKTEYASSRYWGLRRIIYKEIPLTDINNENANDIIFGGFRSLADK